MKTLERGRKTARFTHTRACACDSCVIRDLHITYVVSTSLEFYVLRL